MIQPPNTYKFVLMGEAQAGKTSLAKCMTDKSFSQQYVLTVGVDFLIQKLPSGDKITLWDVSGQERFRPLVENYYPNTHIGILVCDLTNPNSLQNLDKWVTGFRKLAPNARMILAATKSDLTRTISDDQLKDFHMQQQLSGESYFIVSAKTGENVESMFNAAYCLCLTPPARNAKTDQAQSILSEYVDKRDKRRRFKAEKGVYSRENKIHAAQAVISLLRQPPCGAEFNSVSFLANAGAIKAIIQTGWFGADKNLRKAYKEAQKLCPELLPSLKDLENRAKQNK